jgi:hypothetical protein
MVNRSVRLLALVMLEQALLLILRIRWGLPTLFFIEPFPVPMIAWPFPTPTPSAATIAEAIPLISSLVVVPSSIRTRQTLRFGVKHGLPVTLLSTSAGTSSNVNPVGRRCDPRPFAIPLVCRSKD